MGNFQKNNFNNSLLQYCKREGEEEEKKNQPSAHHDRFDRCVGGADSA